MTRALLSLLLRSLSIPSGGLDSVCISLCKKHMDALLDGVTRQARYDGGVKGMS
jgi:hypothetical protein